MRIGRRRAMLGGALVLGGCGKTVASSFEPAPDAGAPQPPPPNGPIGLFDGGSSPDCDASGVGTVFAAEQRRHELPAASVFYSWTTAEQIAEIKQSKQLFTRTERPGLGPGYAMDIFAKRAGNANDDARIAAVLSGDTFAKARYAWTSAWATRMGWPGESYGSELLRIELRPEAWILSFVGRRFSAVDLSNVAVPLPTVLATPERIGAIYFVQDEIYEPCDHDSGVSNGSFYGSFRSPCATPGGYREYILGSDAMVASYAHGTEDIRAEVARGAALVDAYRQRSTWKRNTFSTWNSAIVEAWSSARYGGFCKIDDDLAYELSLAIPSALYEPTQENLQSMITTLKSDPFPAEPFVVRR